MQGKVKWFNNSKSYGLIISDLDNAEIPVFNYKKCLLEGQKVSFIRKILNNIEVVDNLCVINEKHNTIIIKENSLYKTVLNNYPKIEIYDNEYRRAINVK